MAAVVDWTQLPATAIMIVVTSTKSQYTKLLVAFRVQTCEFTYGKPNMK
jgi:hypothetical protein